ncbi:MAG TPA: hypothetical protein VJA26_01550, partial [Gammaproteobacteria bacterium]|nr:hypothetical protein [Gammaproteobacteria bacterium]
MITSIGRLVVVFMVVMSGTTTVDAQTLDTAALETWLERYGDAWETRSADRAAEIFSADALYQEMPFDEPKSGRAGIR